MRVILLGADSAVVTWFMPRDDGPARRSVVLRRSQGVWRIALVHADNWVRSGG